MRVVEISGGNLTLIDDADFASVNEHIWSTSGVCEASKIEYAWNGTIGRLHRFLLQPVDGFSVDHINGDGLDNRRSNLRLCSNRENSHNAAKRATRNCSSAFKGVYLADKKYWCAQIQINGKKVNLGRFADELSAARAYDLAALEHFGEFARLNFPTAEQAGPERILSAFKVSIALQLEVATVNVLFENGFIAHGFQIDGHWLVNESDFRERMTIKHSLNFHLSKPTQIAA